MKYAGKINLICPIRNVLNSINFADNEYKLSRAETEFLHALM